MTKYLKKNIISRNTLIPLTKLLKKLMWFIPISNKFHYFYHKYVHKIQFFLDEILYFTNTAA